MGKCFDSHLNCFFFQCVVLTDHWGAEKHCTAESRLTSPAPTTRQLNDVDEGNDRFSYYMKITIL